MEMRSPKIPVKLDKPRHLLLDMAAVARFEYNTGKPLFSVKTWKKLSIKEMAILLWASLAHEDEKLTPADVVRMFNDETIDVDEVAEKLSSAWGLIIFDLIGGK